MAEQTKNYKFIKPDYEEFADVTVINENMDKIDEAIAGVGVPEEIYNRLTGLEAGKADKNHASATTEYGAASTTQYGHTKLYSGIDSDSESLAATPKAVKAGIAEAKLIPIAGSDKKAYLEFNPADGVVYIKEAGSTPPETAVLNFTEEESDVSAVVEGESFNVQLSLIHI